MCDHQKKRDSVVRQRCLWLSREGAFDPQRPFQIFCSAGLCDHQKKTRQRCLWLGREGSLKLLRRLCDHQKKPTASFLLLTSSAHSRYSVPAPCRNVFSRHVLKNPCILTWRGWMTESRNASMFLKIACIRKNHVL